MQYQVGYAMPKDPVKELTALLLDSVKKIKEARPPFFETLDDPRKKPHDAKDAFEQAKLQVPLIVSASTDVARCMREADFFLRLVAYIVADTPALSEAVVHQAAAAAKALIAQFHPGTVAPNGSVESLLWALLSSVSHSIRAVQSTHLCAGCRKELGTGRHTLYQSSAFHPECFGCSRCKARLGSSSFAVTAAGAPLCPKCQ
jgi:hypothetical protein